MLRLVRRRCRAASGDAGLGHDPPRRGGIVAEFLPQLGDQECADSACRAGGTDPRVSRSSCGWVTTRPALLRRAAPATRYSLRASATGSSVHEPHLAPREVDHAVRPSVEHRCESCTGRQSHASTQQRAHPRHQFLHAERLGDVVVGTGVQRRRPSRFRRRAPSAGLPAPADHCRSSRKHVEWPWRSGRPRSRITRSAPLRRQRLEPVFHRSRPVSTTITPARAG